MLMPQKISVQLAERKAQYPGPPVTAGMSFKSDRCCSDTGAVTTFHTDLDFS